MPSVNMKIEFPGARMARCYSPSTVIHQYFKAGDELSVSEFHTRASAALNEASKRVQEKFGFACSAASDQLMEINEWVTEYESDAVVKIIDLG